MSDLAVKLLVVDDEVEIRTVLKEILRPIYGDVYFAKDGQEALDIITSDPEINCVLSDICMPVMDGIELIRKVRQMKCDIPFIFFTGFGDNKLMLEALKYGAFDFIGKPDFECLEAIVAKGIKHNFSLKQNKTKKIDNNFITEYQKMITPK